MATGMPHKDYAFNRDRIDHMIRVMLPPSIWGNYFLSFLVVFFSLWLPVYGLDFLGRNHFAFVTGTKFTSDYSAVVYLLSVPLLIMAKGIFYSEWLTVHRTIQHSQILAPEQARKLDRIFYLIAGKISSWKTLALVAGLAFSFSMFVCRFTIISAGKTWFYDAQKGMVTPAGIFHWSIGVVAFLTVIFFWAYLYGAWIFYLYKFSTFRPKIIGFHPDRTGGLGFLTDAGMGLSVLVFTIGAIVIAIISYKMDVEGLAFTDPAVLSIFCIYLFLAPVLFFLPLLFFTRNLFAARKEGIFHLNKYGYDFGRYIKENEFDFAAGKDLELFTAIFDAAAAYEYTYKMKIWPVDLESIKRFMLSTLSPIFPLLLRFFHLPEVFSGFFR